MCSSDLSLAGRRRTVLFTCGWMITQADEQAIRLLPATAWQAAVDQDGTVQKDRHVAEVTHLLSRAAGWPAGLRWIVRRTKPSRRQMKNLTAFERATGWRYSIIVTNIPAAGGVAGVPGSHLAQFTDGESEPTCRAALNSSTGLTSRTPNAASISLALRATRNAWKPLNACT